MKTVPYDYKHRTGLAYIRNNSNLAIIKSLLLYKGWIVVSGE